MQFHRPDSLDAALEVLANEPVRLLAGGTDFFPALAGKTTCDPILDLSSIGTLRGISEEAGVWRIGATTTWSDIRDARLPAQFRALQQAAAEVGSLQIQNAGTIAGNICNASPAADGVPPLLALDADVEIAGPKGIRTEPLCDFITGVRRTQLKSDELVTALNIPKQPDGRSCFLKLGARRYLVISIAMVAVNVTTSGDGCVTEISIAVGACSAVARRLRGLEQQLPGTVPGSAELAHIVQAADLSELTPIDDVRASAAYRLDAVRTLITRAVKHAVAGET
ncbi:xanthine dehydrogenase family protein subunit M [Labrenzia sp. 011]|uniref:FAD binding domain-containing protein n=1 Tax=Labrenzia sp. 011 TaxID=2171494 RepID=UPI000D51DFE2|nr:xanthine dehydrogenase family protein subunit M [Labrenzia sp. 011]PVB60119.1 xanthine dehydrogenase [Labrenzia sp. 011]